MSSLARGILQKKHCFETKDSTFGNPNPKFLKLKGEMREKFLYLISSGHRSQREEVVTEREGQRELRSRELRPREFQLFKQRELRSREFQLFRSRELRPRELRARK